MNREEIEARLRAMPRHVIAVNGYAMLLGLVTWLRVVASAYAGQMTYGSALVAGFVFFVLYRRCGISVMDRSRWGFLWLVVLAALPLVGIFVTAYRLLHQLASDAAGLNRNAVVVGAAALVELVVTGILFRHLFAPETNRYVWSKPAEPVAVDQSPDISPSHAAAGGPEGEPP